MACFNWETQLIYDSKHARKPDPQIRDLNAKAGAALEVVRSMLPGQKPKWTKDDTRLCAQMGVALVGSAAVLGWLCGAGLFWGAVGGAGLWSLIVIAALAYGARRR